MKRHDTKIDGRVSSELRALVEQGGERSASLRALLLIGAAACGLDLTAVREELPTLISAYLHPNVRASLFALMSEVEDIPRNVPLSASVDDDALLDDELLGDEDGAGFDV